MARGVKRVHQAAGLIHGSLEVFTFCDSVGVEEHLVAVIERMFVAGYVRQIHEKQWQAGVAIQLTHNVSMKEQRWRMSGTCHAHATLRKVDDGVERGCQHRSPP